MIAMHGNTARLWRYKIEYTQETPDKILSLVQYAVSEEEKERLCENLNGACIVTEIDQSGNEWIDGMRFETREDALNALEMGEAAYGEYQNANTLEGLKHRIASMEKESLSVMQALAELYEETVGEG